MPLSIPVHETTATDSTTTVFVREVHDARRFEDKPPQPRTPSLKGGASLATADVKARAVARKRNTYGKALGDILLEGDRTVTDLVRELVETGLRSGGYEIVLAETASAEDTAVDVRIDEFWAWFTPGFWSVSMEAVIDTTVTMISGDDRREFVVEAYGINRGQSNRKGNWVEAYRRSFIDYTEKFVGKVQGHSLDSHPPSVVGQK